MNFGEIQFWIVLVACGAISIGLRNLVTRVRPRLLAVYDSLALAGTCLFLFYVGAGLSFFIFIVELAFTYLSLRGLSQAPQKWRRIASGMVIMVLLFILGYFKYADFVLNTILHLNVTVSTNGIPPGISFYTFQMVAFVLDTVWDNHPIPGPLSFINFISFFPQIVAGPIERRTDLLPQVERFRFRVRQESLTMGLPIVVLGLFYKLVLADNLASFIRCHQASTNWLPI